MTKQLFVFSEFEKKTIIDKSLIIHGCNLASQSGVIFI